MIEGKDFPSSPGVYRMKDSSGNVLYVGKAKDLKKRIGSYFRQGYEHSTRTRALLKHTADIDYTVTNSELEAFILENNLIKELSPKYNVLMKDNKSFVFIKITEAEDFPRIRVVREREQKEKNATYIGPKTASGKVYETLRVLKKLFPFRHCNLDISYEGGNKVSVTNKVIEYPCLDYYIKRCPGPCIGAIDPVAYKKIVQKAVSFLKGHHDEVFRGLKDQMMEAATEKKFEQAARIRDRLQILEALGEKQIISDPERKDTDIFNYCIEMGRIFVTIFLIRGGKLINQENFVFDTLELRNENDVSPEEIIASFMANYYEKTTDFPKEIFIPEAMKDEEKVTLESWLHHIAGHKIHIATPQKGAKNALLNLCKKNALTFAKQYRIKWLSEEADKSALENLAREIGLPKDTCLNRIECYDISHIFGQDTVGSMVVFEKGVPKKEHYRQFKLRATQGKPNDFGSMTEVVTRRIKYLATPQKATLRKAKKAEIGAFFKKLKVPASAQKEMTYWLLENEKKSIGWCAVRIHANTVCEIVRWETDASSDENTATFELLKNVIEKMKQKRVYVGLPKAQREAAIFILNCGFEAIVKVPDVLRDPKKDFFVFDKIKHKSDPAFAKKPDLLVIDGGLPQLKATCAVLERFQIKIPVVALAKKLEEIYVPGGKAPLLLESGEPALTLLQRMRDEAHRFAITAHRKLHGKNLLKA